MNSELQGRNVVVTGGKGALGQEIVNTLLERGAQCWIPSYEAVSNDDPRQGVHVVGGVDLSNESATQDFFANVPSLWASVHVAGGFAMATLEATTLADFEKMWRMNTVSCFLSCREAVKRMREAQGGGRIVNVAARPAIEPAGGMVAYTTSKAGVASLTECLARELATEAIAVNAIVPAVIDTPANRAAMPNADHDSWPKVTEIAQAAAFLVSPANVTISGALVPVYGKMG